MVLTKLSFAENVLNRISEYAISENSNGATGKKFRLCCVICGEKGARFNSLVSFSGNDYTDLLLVLGIENQIEITDVLKNRLYFGKCNNTLRKRCKKSAFSYDEFVETLEYANIERPGLVDNLIFTESCNFIDECANHGHDNTRNGEFHETSFSRPQYNSSIFDSGICVMDKTLFENLQCRKYYMYLRICNFTIDHLWGSILMLCPMCQCYCTVRTVKNTCEITKRFNASVDLTGSITQKAQDLFLANNLIPPKYYSDKVDNDSITDSALKIASVSTKKALAEEADDNKSICARADFGWHNRANNNSNSGLYKLSKLIL